MRSHSKVLKCAAMVCAAIGAAGASAARAATFTVDPTNVANYNGFVNVFERAANGGGYVFGQPFGADALTATFSGTTPSSTLTLQPCAINDTSSFWYQGAGTNPGGPGVAGNKNVDASYYVQDDALAGTSVTFQGTVQSNTLAASGYSTTVFIKAFAADYSSSTGTSVALTPGAFNITFAAPAGTHVQYGFETIGLNVWPTDVNSKGSVVLSAAATAVPEPTSLAAAGLAAVGLVRRRRR